MIDEREHRRARQEIQLSPDEPPLSAVLFLRSIGYKEADILRLRLNAGARVAETAHPLPPHMKLPGHDLTTAVMLRPILTRDELKKCLGV